MNNTCQNNHNVKDMFIIEDALECALLFMSVIVGQIYSCYKHPGNEPWEQERAAP